MTTDDYGSHLPFLAWIGQHMRPISSVLELGAGKFSTPMWLNRDYFPQVESVVSVEHDERWLPLVNDPRLRVVHTDVALYAEALMDLSPYDLVFVDNGTCAEERVRAITAVLACTSVPLVVLHDWENESYRWAAREGYSWVITDDATPQTALLLQGRR